MTIQEVFPRSSTTRLTFEMEGENLVVQYTDTNKHMYLDKIRVGGFGCQFRISDILNGYQIEFNEPSAYLKAQVKRVRTEPNRVMRWNIVKRSILSESHRLTIEYDQVIEEVWLQCKQRPKPFKIGVTRFGSTSLNRFSNLNDWPERLENYEELLSSMMSITNEELKTAIYENL